jgi:putative transposase
MAMKRFSAEQIVAKLRQIEVLLGEGEPLGLACKEAGGHGCHVLPVAARVRGLKGDQAKRLKELERENARLKRVAADLTLEKAILKDVAEGNF